MQGLLSRSLPLLLWGLFFATDLYGHLVLKMTLGRDLPLGEMAKRLLATWTGWSIFFTDF